MRCEFLSLVGYKCPKHKLLGMDGSEWGVIVQGTEILRYGGRTQLCSKLRVKPMLSTQPLFTRGSCTRHLRLSNVNLLRQTNCNNKSRVKQPWQTVKHHSRYKLISTYPNSLKSILAHYKATDKNLRSFYFHAYIAIQISTFVKSLFVWPIKI